MENDNLERFADYLPSLVIASDNKQIPKRSERYMPKEVGILKPYIVANHKRCIRFLTFDIDAEDSAFRWDSGRVATPTYNIINGESGHAHYLYEIRDTLPKRSLWSAKTQKKVNELVNGYKLALGADRVIIYQTLVSKNPCSEHWKTIANDALYGLTEMLEYIDASDIAIRKQKSVESNTSVSIEASGGLFDDARLFAYGAVARCESESKLYGKLFDYIKANSVILKQKDIEQLTKTITNWTWKRRGQFKLNQSILTPEEKKLSLKQKQKLSAEFTHETRKLNTTNSILIALERCINEGIKPTCQKVSELSGLSIATVKRNYDLIANFNPLLSNSFSLRADAIANFNK